MLSRLAARNILRSIYLLHNVQNVPMYLDGYTNIARPMDTSSMEHVVPKCYLPKSKVWDLHNLLLVEMGLNHFRSNTKFGRETIKRISFCPEYPKSRGIVARKCAHMFETNPTLFKKQELILDPELMEEWMCKYPISEGESCNLENEYLYGRKNHIVFFLLINAC